MYLIVMVLHSVLHGLSQTVLLRGEILLIFQKYVSLHIQSSPDNLTLAFSHIPDNSRNCF